MAHGTAPQITLSSEPLARLTICQYSPMQIIINYFVVHILFIYIYLAVLLL
jgi:hypothetical protein